MSTDKAKAAEHKAQGNACLARKEYAAAIDAYTQVCRTDGGAGSRSEAAGR